MADEHKQIQVDDSLVIDFIIEVTRLPEMTKVHVTGTALPCIQSIMVSETGAVSIMLSLTEADAAIQLGKDN